MGGKSISITLPDPLIGELQEEANKIGISRSRFISYLLLKWQEDKMALGKIQDKCNKCANRKPGGLCSAYGFVCNAPQSEAETCAGYKDKEIIS